MRFERFERNKRFQQKLSRFSKLIFEVHCGLMHRRALTVVLTFFLLIGTVLCSVLPAGAWYCEGKQCGLSLWACCCADPVASQDGKCGTPAAGSSTNNRFTICKAGCSCAMVMSSADDCHHTLPPAISDFDPLIVLAILPSPVASYVPPVLIETDCCRIDIRGPSARRIAHSSLSPRAPPAA